MGWSLGYDNSQGRDIGYGVPAYCDHPDCWAEIDRGLAHVCGGEPYGGEKGCGLYFCAHHLTAFDNKCPRCARFGDSKTPFKVTKPEHPDWIQHKLTDESWTKWREENPERVARLEKGYAYIPSFTEPS